MKHEALSKLQQKISE